MTLFMGGIGGTEILVVILIISTVMLLVPVLALVDILRSRFEGNEKLIWVLVVIFFSIIGSILYFAIGRNKRIQ